MKKALIPVLPIIILSLSLYFINPITDKLANVFENEPKLVIKKANEFTKNGNYLFVQKTDNFTPYSYQDLLNIFYSVIDNGWNEFTFYCPKEYTKCLADVSKISGDELILTHLNNYSHPFNSFTNVKTSISDSGEITFKVFYLYDQKEINDINTKVNGIINSIIKDNMDATQKIKTIHDYIIDNAKYDVERNLTGNSNYKSYNAYGPLFQGFATCNGYTDLMAIL